MALIVSVHISLLNTRIDLMTHDIDGDHRKSKVKMRHDSRIELESRCEVFELIF